MPAITMRTYSEEKRSGTIELLLTSPSRTFRSFSGKFLGAMGLCGRDAGRRLIHIGILFIYGNPEWKPIATAYLGLLLFGACFISSWLVHLEPDQEPGGGVRGDVRRFLFLWVINWIGELLGTHRQRADATTCRSSTTSMISPRASSIRRI